jgi:hypothetical protein
MIRKLLPALLLIIMLLAPARVAGASDLRLVSSSTKADFPNLLAFNMSAESPGTITRVRLRYEVDKVTYAPSFAEAWPDIEPGKSVSASWTWDMRKGSLPPGAKITYWWIVEDDEGGKLTSSKETVFFEDTRYKWQKITDKMINILWYQGNSSFAEQLLQAGVDARARLEADAGVILDKPVSIYIYASYRDLRGSIVAAEEWTGGVAYAGFSIISIGISPNNLDWGKGAVAHELGHLITHQVTISPYGGELPPWLDEGLAMHAEGQQPDADKVALRKSITDGTIATLKSLSSPFSADPQQAFFAYAQSRSVIEYLADNFDKNRINDLLITLNNGASMDDALTRVYGFNLDGLDEAWMKWLMSQPDKKTSARPEAAPGAVERLLRSLSPVLTSV